MNKSFKYIKNAAYASILSSFILPTAATAEAVLTPNQLVGTFEFTNTNPQVLNILKAEGLNEGLTQIFVRADSIGVTPALNNYAFINATDRTQVDYEITVESSEQGIPYKLTSELRLDSGGEKYLIEPITSDPLLPEPNADVRNDIQQCASVLDIRFQDSSGNPVSVHGGNILANRQHSSGYFIMQAQKFAIAANTTQEYLTVNGDGSQYRVDTYYKDINGVSGLCQIEVNASCDTVIPVPCILDAASPVGSITGNIAIEGEQLLDINHLTRLRAFNGPLKHSDTVKVAGAGQFLFDKMVPSDAESPARDYIVYGEMAYRKGYSAQYMRTPWLGNYANPGVTVVAGEVTDLTDSFVMDPGYVSGSILLAGPLGRSNISALYRSADTDYNQDGSPDDITLSGGSRVFARGTNTLAPGASLKSWGGEARSSFTGHFEAENNAFIGQYEMVLGGLNREASVWRPSDMVLRFMATQTPDIPESYQQSWMIVSNNNIPNTIIEPGSQTAIDHGYCLNEVVLNYRSLAGSFYNPKARAIGNYIGEDFQGKAANYSANLVWANGTPNRKDLASDRGMVKMSLPQGSYIITPTVTALNPATGTTSNTELPPVDITVGCGQTLNMSTEIQVELAPLATESSDGSVVIEGQVKGNQTADVSISVNDSEDSLICSNCSEFSSTVELEPGINEITVNAVTDDGETASIQTTIENTYQEPEDEQYDDLVISSCSDINVKADDYKDGSHVNFNTTATGGCDTPKLSCSSQSGDWFNIGDTSVSCKAYDSCSNEASCEFNVQVEEANVCSQKDKEISVTQVLEKDFLWPVNHELTDIGLNITVEGGCNTADNNTEIKAVTEVWSDEAELPLTGKQKTKGKASGNGPFAPDAKDFDTSLRLRSERDGSRDGRIYLIISHASQDGQNAHSCKAVMVPHSLGKKDLALSKQQAATAESYCEETGKAPSSFVRHGISDEVGPKQ